MSNENILKISESEQKELFPSLYYMISHLHEFVEKFYENLLKTDAGKLFNQDRLENQKKKFEASFKIILYNIQHPMNLQDHLNTIVSKHLELGIRPDHIDNFTEAFMISINELFQNYFDLKILKIWEKLMSDLLAYFNKKIA